MAKTVTAAEHTEDKAPLAHTVASSCGPAVAER